MKKYKHTQVVCVGNGESRLGYDLFRLWPYAVLYGCNALYRDFSPDVLFAMDGKMAEEVHESGYANGHRVFVRYPDKCSRAILLPDDPGWASGTTSVLVACRAGFRRVYLLGHDLKGEGAQICNVYKGTPNYAPEHAPVTTHVHWLSHFLQIFERYPEVEFIRTLPGFIPQEFRGIKNLRHIQISDLLREVRFFFFKFTLRERSTLNGNNQ